MVAAALLPTQEVPAPGTAPTQGAPRERERATAVGRGLSPDAQDRLDGWGHPSDYESRWWEHLRTCGVSAARLAYYDVHLCVRADERRPHPGREPRLFYRYPVWDEDGELPLCWRLAAVDGEHPRTRWEGPPHPELLYEPLSILPGRPLVVCGDVLSAWVLSSLDIASCTFLCGPGAHIPERAVGQIAAGAPSSVLVVDNGSPALPSGAHAVASALRAAGVAAGYARLSWSSGLYAPAELTMVELVAQQGRSGLSPAEHGKRVLVALAQMARERAS